MDHNEVNTKEMAEQMMQIGRASEHSINTVHVTDVPYAEIPICWALKWKDQLEETWHLIDANGNHHMVKYNMCQKNPEIRAGWPSLRQFYNLQGNCQVRLTHYGESVFLITVFKTASEPKAFPKWHSLYKQNPESSVFRIWLNEYKVSASALDVPSELYYYLKDTLFTTVCFEGRAVCKIVFNHWRKSAKLGAGWKAFARANDLKADSEFIMEFPYPSCNIAHWWICSL